MLTAASIEGFSIGLLAANYDNQCKIGDASCSWQSPDHNDIRSIDMAQKTIHERFSEKYEVRGDCWIWAANKYLDGYGQIKFEGSPRRAHRVSYILYKGPIPEGMLVCHTCDTPLCVNPDHLWLGTHADNHADRNAKGRQARGENNMGGDKLTDESVREIKSLLSEGVPQRKIARQYDVSQSLICDINRGRVWTHVNRRLD